MTRGAILILLFATLAVGCNYTKETDPPPPVEVPATYTEGAEVPPPPDQEKTEPVRDARWWRQMGDPTLNALIEEALRRNQGVRAGWARVRQARYIANQVRAARMPQIGVQGDYTIGREIQVFGEFEFQNATGSLPISYEVDLFARRARDHQGAKLDAQAARLDQEALAITISAEVAERPQVSRACRTPVPRRLELCSRRAPTTAARREPARAPRSRRGADRFDRPTPVGFAGRGSRTTFSGR